MSFDIRYPSITSPTEKGQLEQIRAYLFQLADQLKFALNSIDGDISKVIYQGNQSEKKSLTEEEAQATFGAVKSLIIKSADIVNAYYEEIKNKLVGDYEAQSAFGTYSEQTEQNITENSKEIDRAFKNIQKITTDINNLQAKLMEVNARIKAGLLYYDDNEVPIYGVEVGQTNDIDGVEVFNKYARFTSDRLSFYDKNNTEVAYISDYKLYITNAQVTGTLTLGRFEMDASNGLAIKWV